MRDDVLGRSTSSSCSPTRSCSLADHWRIAKSRRTTASEQVPRARESRAHARGDGRGRPAGDRGGHARAVLVERAGRAVARHVRADARRHVRPAGRGRVRQGQQRRRRSRRGARCCGAWRRCRRVRARRRYRRRSTGARGARRPAIDAMFGTGFRGALDGDAGAVVPRLVARGAATLAVDIPSGVDGATGEVRGAAVHADETVCFAALKPGLLFEPGRAHAGTCTSSTSASTSACRRARGVTERRRSRASGAGTRRAQVVGRRCWSSAVDGHDRRADAGERGRGA